MKNKNRVKLLFWDWTGTLADEASLDRAVCEEMEKEIARQRLIPLAEARNLFKNYLKELEGRWEWHDYVRHGRKFRIPWRRIQERHLDKLRLLPGALEVLCWAREKGYLNLLTTNAVRPVINLRLRYLKIESLFDGLITSDDVRALKASGQHFERGLKLFPALPSACFSIGDNPIQDIASARRLGLRTILCRFGSNFTHYHTTHLSPNHQEQVSADFVVFSLSEIKEILRKVEEE